MLDLNIKNDQILNLYDVEYTVKNMMLQMLSINEFTFFYCFLCCLYLTYRFDIVCTTSALTKLTSKMPSEISIWFDAWIVSSLSQVWMVHLPQTCTIQSLNSKPLPQKRDGHWMFVLVRLTIVLVKCHWCYSLHTHYVLSKFCEWTLKRGL